MQQDGIYKEPQKNIADFNFGETVVQVFDDMVIRSVPYYLEMQRMMAEMATSFAVPGANVYDLGCSTGTTLLGFNKVLDPNINFVGIDESAEMVKKCTGNFSKAFTGRQYKVEQCDLNDGIIINNASVVVMCLVLQFVRPLNREHLISEINRQLNENGCLILVEKVLGEDSMLNREFIKYYYDFKKRNNYSEMEISQKREALENVLIPYRLSENIGMLFKCRFRFVEIFFKWYNFSGIIAVK